MKTIGAIRRSGKKGFRWDCGVDLSVSFYELQSSPAARYLLTGFMFQELLSLGGQHHNSANLSIYLAKIEGCFKLQPMIDFRFLTEDFMPRMSDAEAK